MSNSREMLVRTDRIIPEGTGLPCSHGSSWAYRVENVCWQSDGRVVYNWYFKCAAQTDGVTCDARSAKFSKELSPKRSTSATPTAPQSCQCELH